MKTLYFVVEIELPCNVLEKKTQKLTEGKQQTFKHIIKPISVICERGGAEMNTEKKSNTPSYPETDGEVSIPIIAVDGTVSRSLRLYSA